MRIFAAFSLVVFSLPAFATDWMPAYEKTFPRQKAECLFAGQKFTAEIRGVKKEVDSEEAEFGSAYIYATHKGKPQILWQNYDHNLFGEFSFEKVGEGQKSRCKGARAYDLGKEFLAIPVWKNGRPFSDDLFFILFSAKASGFPVVTSTFSHVSAVVGQVDGFSFRQVIGRSDKDIRTAEVQGETIQFEEEDLGIWQTVVATKDGIKKKNDLDLTWEKLKFRRFFADKAAFSKASNINEEDTSSPKFYAYFGKGKKVECLTLNLGRNYFDVKELICLPLK